MVEDNRESSSKISCYLSNFSRVQKSATPVSLAQFVKQEDSTSVDPGHTVMEQVGLVIPV